MSDSSRLYTVFVSSTFEDLKEEREAVSLALQQAGYIPRGMELFPSSSQTSWSVIDSVMRQCDIYVLIIGGRYGSSPPGRRTSYTEREFARAKKLGLPCLVFAVKDPLSLPASRVDMTEEGQRRLLMFRDRATATNTRFWTDARGLALDVVNAVNHEVDREALQGWSRRGRVGTGNGFTLDGMHRAIDILPDGYSEEKTFELICEQRRMSTMRIVHMLTDGTQLTEFEVLEPTNAVRLSPQIKAGASTVYDFLYLGREITLDERLTVKLALRFTEPAKTHHIGIITQEGVNHCSINIRFADEVSAPATVKANLWLGSSGPHNYPIQSTEHRVGPSRAVHLEHRGLLGGQAFSADWDPT